MGDFFGKRFSQRRGGAKSAGEDKEEIIRGKTRTKPEGIFAEKI